MTKSTEQAKGLEPVQADCLQALRLLACGRGWLVFLLTVAVLFEIAMFAAGYWGGVLPAPTDQETGLTGSEPGRSVAVGLPRTTVSPRAAASEWPDTQPMHASVPWLGSPTTWYVVMQVGLPVAGFVGLVSAILLVVVAWAGMQMMVLGRLGAIATITGSFFWALVALVALLPWSGIVGSATGRAIPWAFYRLDEIAQAGAAFAAEGGISPKALVRFIVWPVVALLIVWVSGVRFGKAYWQAAGIAELEAKARAQQSREI